MNERGEQSPEAYVEAHRYRVKTAHDRGAAVEDEEDQLDPHDLLGRGEDTTSW